MTVMYVEDTVVYEFCVVVYSVSRGVWISWWARENWWRKSMANRKSMLLTRYVTWLIEKWTLFLCTVYTFSVPALFNCHNIVKVLCQSVLSCAKPHTLSLILPSFRFLCTSLAVPCMCIQSLLYSFSYVFWSFQSQFPEVDGSELSALDKQISELQKQLQESKSQCQTLNSGFLSPSPPLHILSLPLFSSSHLSESLSRSLLLPMSWSASASAFSL